MSKTNGIISRSLKGALGKEIVFREWEGKTIVAKAPKSREGEPSDAQVQIQEKFLLATKYAKAILTDQDPGLRDAYAAVLRPRQNIYSRALEDFLSPPKIRSISTSAYDGTVGSKIAVRALDDFRVASVSVEIRAANGSLLEKGNAEPSANGIDWTYTATKVNIPTAGSKIMAMATDVPGNDGTKEVVL